jgi:16S rRNA (cytidine1402-2'-O)-methyltransferase
MLYICATPIGNLDDISLRALEILAKADIILCEDTRNSQKLLNHHGINQKRLIALHDHNENEVSQKVLEWLNQELLIVQISDAGTPGISDPGARLCNVLHANQITPHPLPGACAYISLLSVSGIVDTPSLFHGFLPNKSSQRQKQLNTWLSVEYAVAIYESPHRILDSLSDLVQCLGEAREIVMGREMTKHFETIKKLSAGENRVRPPSRAGLPTPPYVRCRIRRF